MEEPMQRMAGNQRRSCLLLAAFVRGSDQYGRKKKNEISQSGEASCSTDMKGILGFVALLCPVSPEPWRERGRGEKGEGVSGCIAFAVPSSSSHASNEDRLGVKVFLTFHRFSLPPLDTFLLFIGIM